MTCHWDMTTSKPTPLEYWHGLLTGPSIDCQPVWKRLCYFWTPIYPGLCYVASGWEMEANFKDFWPGVRELLAHMVHGGLRYAERSCRLRRQPARKMLKLLRRQRNIGDG